MKSKTENFCLIAQICVMECSEGSLVSQCRLTTSAHQIKNLNLLLPLTNYYFCMMHSIYMEHVDKRNPYEISTLICAFILPLLLTAKTCILMKYKLTQFACILSGSEAGQDNTADIVFADASFSTFRSNKNP